MNIKKWNKIKFIPCSRTNRWKALWAWEPRGKILVESGGLGSALPLCLCLACRDHFLFLWGGWGDTIKWRLEKYFEFRALWRYVVLSVPLQAPVATSDEHLVKVGSLIWNTVSSPDVSRNACVMLPHRYELGAALFIGWAGASLCIIGGVIFCFSISDNKTPRYEKEIKMTC